MRRVEPISLGGGPSRRAQGGPARLALWGFVLACGPSEPPAPPPELLEPLDPPPNAAPLVAYGDVQADRVSFATRSSGYSRVWITLGESPGASTWRSEDADVLPARDFTARFTVSGLPPDTTLTFTLHGSTTAAPDPGQPIATGRLRTAPAPEAEAAVRLALVGDLGGQGRCRPAEGGYRVLKSVLDQRPSVVLANGDMIYADGDCPATGPDGVAQVLGDFPAIQDPLVDWRDARRVREIFDAHWRYNRSDANAQALLAAAPLVAQWDDHEVINDMGPWPTWRTGDPAREGYPQLYALGREVFLDWNPVAPHPEEPGRIYRSLRWGRHLELFVVDARSYRSPNDAPDGPDKTLLGAAQLDWLVSSLTRSEATWRVVSVDVPLSVPTGSAAWRAGRDGWADGEGDPTTPEGAPDLSAETGYERELGALLAALDRADLDGLVFVSTDVHFAQIIQYNTDADGDGDLLVFHEVITGPLRAWMGQPQPLDPTFGPRSLWAEGGAPFFATLDIPEDGATLTLRVHGEDGGVRPGAELVLDRPSR